MPPYHFGASAAFVALLRAFGDVVFWEERERRLLAPPWLIYSELFANTGAELRAVGDPREHEAAEELYSKFLA
jgi:hypothetical protein